ncbi:major facilitator superfamily domain-containing protein [Cladochytrium replicatum]|nr:major facilitator superfamily domain-containing protein [Cladochytrium replicatum]
MATNAEFVRGLITFARPTSDPYTWSNGRKRLILFVCGISSATAGFTSTVYLPSLPTVTADLKAAETEVNLTMSLFILFMGIGPVLCATISDTYQTRRKVNVACMSLFVLVSALGYIAPNISSLIVIRILQAVGGAAGMSTAFGTVSDFYPPHQRGSAMGFVSSMATIGPLIGPILGGFIASAWGWRSTFAVTACLGGVFLLLHLFCAPDTFRDVKIWEAESDETKSKIADVPVEDSEEFGKDGGSESREDTIVSAGQSDDSAKPENQQLVLDIENKTANAGKPIPQTRHVHPLLMVFRMLGVDFVFFTALCAAVGFSVMFATETIIPILYFEEYGFDSSKTGLTFLAGGTMNVVSAIVAGRTSDYFYSRAKEQRLKRMQAEPESALTGEVSKDGGLAEDRFTPWTFFNCFIIVPFGTLLFGWSIWAKLPIGVPIAAFGFICFGFTDSMMTASTFLVDATAKYGRASSASSAANLFRMVFACILSVVSTPWVRAIGVQWLCTLFAGLSILSGLGLLALKRTGAKMRAKSSSVFA